MLICLDETYFESSHIAAIRPVDDGDDQCIVYLAGASAMDAGFLIYCPIDDVVQLIQNANIIAMAKAMDDATGSDSKIPLDDDRDSVLHS